MTMTRIPYSGATPGADSNAYTLFSSVTAWPSTYNALSQYGQKRYVLRLEFCQNCSVTWQQSNDRGTNWRPVGTQALTATAPGTYESVTIDVVVEGFQDFRVFLTNAGTAQGAGFTVDQSLDTDRSPLV
jgi:hypothetical protein